LSKVPAGNPILLTLNLDLDGILHVYAKEKRTGLEKSITIENAISRFEGDELAQAKERIGQLFGESADQIPQSVTLHQQIVQARALVEKAEHLLEKASADDREEMINLIETIKDAIAKEDVDGLSKPTEQLSEILYYLES
jgi:molecular chaperone DnaK (HSP70)